MNIGRTLFWFHDGNDMLTELNDDFFALGTLLNRLLNEKYDGKRIKFINIDFSTDKTYELYPILPKETAYYYGGHLRYYGVLCKELIERLDANERNKYVWDMACKYLGKSATYINNKKLSEAIEYAYEKGIKINLNPDYRMVENDIIFLGQQLKISVWVNFKEDGMHSKFAIEKGGEIVFEKEIDKARIGIEFFLEMYKKIELEGNNIVLKGLKDVEYLPLKISLEGIVL